MESRKRPAGGFIQASNNNNSDVTLTEAVSLKAPEKTIIYPLEENETCRHCSSIELDAFLKEHYAVNVCENCRRNIKDGYYKLITKTTAMKEFLLTSEELDDRSVLPWARKANPYRSDWTNMRLYLLGHVRDFAIKKWESLESIEKEHQHREELKGANKNKKFRQLLGNLRRKTLAEGGKSRQTKQNSHVHHFVVLQKDGTTVKECTDCGLSFEAEEFGS